MKQRGSAILYIVFMAAVCTTVLVAFADLANTEYNGEIQRECSYTADRFVDGAITLFNVDFNTNEPSLPLTKTYTVAAASGGGTQTVQLTVTDNNASKARTLAVSAQLTLKGSTYTRNLVIGRRDPVYPNLYALYVNSSLSGAYNITINSPNMDGALAVNGDIGTTGNVTVDGDIDIAGTIGTPTYKGYFQTGATSLNWPTLTSSTYVTAAGTKLTGNQTWSAIVLVPPLEAVSGSVTMHGAAAGYGGLYANSFTIDGDITQALGINSYVSSGNINVNSGVNKIAGYFYTDGNFVTNGPLIVNGGIACKSLSLGGDLTINFNDSIWTTISLGNSLRLPGVWP